MDVGAGAMKRKWAKNNLTFPGRDLNPGIQNNLSNFKNKSFVIVDKPINYSDEEQPV